jgi:hypothetical protein
MYREAGCKLPGGVAAEGNRARSGALPAFHHRARRRGRPAGPDQTKGGARVSLGKLERSAKKWRPTIRWQASIR